MKKAALIFYYLIFSKLPNSWWPGGKLYNKLRIGCLKKIIIIGCDNKIQKAVYVGSGNEIKVGNGCQINERVRLDNVEIGNNVMIGRESIILGKMHESGGRETPMNEQGVKAVSKAIIEDDVWLGLRVIIMPGIKIKTGCIIGAGAVVTKDTEPFGIYAGVPARLVKYRK